MTSYKSITKLYIYYKQRHLSNQVNYSNLLLWIVILMISLSKYVYYSLQLMQVDDLYLEDFVTDTIDMVFNEQVTALLELNDDFI
jgi:uncharacterized membrane protein